MGAGASVVADNVGQYYDEIMGKMAKGRPAAPRAQWACKRLREFELKLHEALMEMTEEKIVDTLGKIADIGKIAGEDSEEYAIAINVASALWLCVADEDLGNRHADELMRTGFTLMGNETFPEEYAQLLMNFHSLRSRQATSESEILWARNTLWELLARTDSDATALVRSLRTRSQNLCKAHRENDSEQGFTAFQQQGIKLLGIDSSGNAMQSSESAPMLQGIEKSMHVEETVQSDHEDYTGEEDDFFESSSTASGYVAERAFTRKDFGRGLTWITQSSDITNTTELSELQRVLFDMVLSCFETMDGETLAEATTETLANCSDSQLIDTLTRCNEEGDTLLLAACRVSNAKVVEILLKVAKNLRGSMDLTPQLFEARNGVGLTPLHIAVHSNYASYEVANILLYYGGSSICHATDRAGCTPLHYAAATGIPDIVANLLLHGASPLHRDRHGFIPVDYCDPGNVETFNMLYSSASSMNESSKDLSFSGAVQDAAVSEAWETRFDAARSKNYFYNRVTREVSFLDDQIEGKEGEKTDKELLMTYFKHAWRCGLVGMVSKRKKVASEFHQYRTNAREFLIRNKRRDSVRHLSLKQESKAPAGTVPVVASRAYCEDLEGETRLALERRAQRDGEQDQRALEEARSQLRSAHESLEKLVVDLQSAEAERDANQARLVELQSNLKASTEHGDLKETEKQAVAEFHHADERAKSLEQDLAESRQVHNETAQAMKELETRLQQEESQREFAQQVIETMSSKLRSANEDVGSFTKHLEKEQVERERAAAELARVQREMDAIRQNRQSDAQAMKQIDHMAGREKELISNLQQHEAGIANLQRELMIARYKADEAAEQLAEIKKKLENERALRLDFADKLGFANAKVQAMEDERKLENMQWELERSHNERERAKFEDDRRNLELQLDLERKNRERKGAEAHNKAEMELEQLRAQLIEEKRHHEEKDEELRKLRLLHTSALKKEKEELVERLKKEQKQREEAFSRLAESNQKLEEEKRLRKAQLGDEVAKLQERLRKEAEEKARHQKELDRIKADMNSLKAKHEAQAGQSAEEAAKVKELAEKEQQLAMQMKEMEDYMSKLEKDKQELHKEFVEEQALRKRYYNEIEDLKGRIRVYCRVRPMSKSELERNCQCIINVLDDMRVRLEHPDETNPLRRKKDDIEFSFDACFAPEKSQVDVFKDVQRLIQVAIDGYNVCIFAYGQTGSGKTYTLIGQDAILSMDGPSCDVEPEDAGVAIRAIFELFRVIDRDSSRFDFNVSMYVLELYKETMVDLLNEFDEEILKSSKEPTKPPPLSIRLDAQGVVDVENATKSQVTNANDAIQGLRSAFAKRKVTSTQMNSQSSRSHLICSFLIESTAKKTGVVTNGKLTIVDLAGSERASKTGASGETLKEAQAINKSLLALGDVIHALTTNAKHVPYRNHPLTEIMSDSIGGNAKTLMFVNISPADYNLGETKESLRWATRVKEVTNTSSKNTETAQVKALKKQLERLKKAAQAKEVVEGKAADAETSSANYLTNMTSLRDLKPPPTSHAAKRHRLKRPPPPIDQKS